MSKTHSKIKNTGILFELLTRQITSDIISGNESKAIHIVKEFFNSKTELFKEWQLYQTLIKDKFDSENKAESLVNECLKERAKINEKKLFNEKYNLVKAIKESFDIDSFFKYRINDYKVYASIYKLFEEKQLEPTDLVTSKFTLIEHITQKDMDKKTIVSEIKGIYSKLDEDIRLLAYKRLIEIFNERYDGLSIEQKKLLEQYINNITNSTTLKTYIEARIPEIKQELELLYEKVDDDITKIKLEEVTNNLDNFMKGAIATNEHVLRLLRYYALINELKEIS